VVTHRNAVPDVPASISLSDKKFNVCFFVSLLLPFYFADPLKL